MSTSLEQLVGQAVGNCCVEALLHHGRLSVVYRAQYVPQAQPVALTFFLPPANWSPGIHQQFMTRFMHHSTQLLAISHPNLLPIYERGERGGYPYLITPYIARGSLATILQQRGKCTLATAQHILKQLTSALEHAHRMGFTHRSLKLAHIIMHKDQFIQVTGLGLAQLLEKRGIVQDATPFAHLQTIAGTMLVAPKYLAPECILGQQEDMRSDVYALGIILYEMLSGVSPFTNTLSLEAVMQRQQQSLPSLHTTYSDLPPALDTVLQQALAWEPAMRFQRVSELSAAFTWALQVKSTAPARRSTDPLQHAAPFPAHCDPHQHASSQCASCSAMPATREAGSAADDSTASDPYTGRPATARLPQNAVEQYDMLLSSRPHPVRHGSRRRRSRRRGMSRRQALALLMVSGGVLLGGVSLSKANLAQLVNEATHRPPSTQTSTNSAMPSTTNAPARINQPPNSAQAFINPKDGKQGLLIRLSSGTYVAYERACTHVGVAVNYDPNTHLLVCPAHGSIFDPAHQGRVIQGPATLPLPQVHLHTNPDGSVTTE